jgi:hypothetical protein
MSDLGDVSNSSSFLAMLKDKRTIKFGARCREINRKYEENNNQEVDNGVYNQFDETDSDHSRRSLEEEVDQAIELQENKETTEKLEQDASLTPLETAS